MTLWEKASAVLPPGETLEDLLLQFAKEGCVVVNPFVLVLAKPIAYRGTDIDCWWVYLAAGSAEHALLAMPFYLPLVAFERKGRVKVMNTEMLTRRLL